jgi:hypothetical protein
MPFMQAEGALVGIQRPAVPVRKNPVLLLPVDVQEIPVGKGFVLRAGNREALFISERLAADGTLLVGPDGALYLPYLRLNLVEKIIEIRGICKRKKAQTKPSDLSPGSWQEWLKSYYHCRSSKSNEICLF